MNKKIQSKYKRRSIIRKKLKIMIIIIFMIMEMFLILIQIKYYVAPLEKMVINITDYQKIIKRKWFMPID